MQANLERGKAASGVRSVRRFAILAGVPLIATLTFGAPDRAVAACGASRPAAVHAGGGGSVHAATSRPATSGGDGGGGGGTLGCANGSSASALHGLPVAASGRVVETGVHAAAHTGTHARTAATKTAATKTATTRTTTTRTATTRTANTSAHLGGVKPRRP